MELRKSYIFISLFCFILFYVFYLLYLLLIKIWEFSLVIEMSWYWKESNSVSQPVTHGQPPVTHGRSPVSCCPIPSPDPATVRTAAVSPRSSYSSPPPGSVSSSAGTGSGPIPLSAAPSPAICPVVSGMSVARLKGINR